MDSFKCFGFKKENENVKNVEIVLRPKKRAFKFFIFSLKLLSYLEQQRVYLHMCEFICKPKKNSLEKSFAKRKKRDQK